jgi:hypothetical protein
MNEDLEHCLKDYKYFAEKYFLVKTEDGYKPLDLNEPMYIFTNRRTTKPISILEYFQNICYQQTH